MKTPKASLRERERERERIKSLRDFILHLITVNIFERRFWRRFLYLQKGREIKKFLWPRSRTSSLRGRSTEIKNITG